MTNWDDDSACGAIWYHDSGVQGALRGPVGESDFTSDANSDLPAPEEEQRASGRYAAVPVKPTRVVPSEGHCFQHRVDAELGHEIPRMGADGIHGEV